LEPICNTLITPVLQKRNMKSDFFVFDLSLLGDNVQKRKVIIDQRYAEKSKNSVHSDIGREDLSLLCGWVGVDVV
jgi:hypothetical protein